MSDPNASIVEVRSYFVRGRNALLARADFEPLYIDYYLHLAEYGLKYSGAQDLMLKETLAAFTLHLASRPQDQGAGWTMNFQEPRMNLFVTGSSRPGKVAGRIFTEDVRDFGKGLLVAQTTQPGSAAQQSMVEFHGTDIFKIVEDYYAQSEQRLTRLFRYSEEDIIMISAQPDCDEAWLASLTDDDVRKMDEKETLSLLETREYIWECGCSIDRLFPLLDRMSERDLEDTFGEDEIITLTCPRCASRYRASKEQFEAWRAAQAAPKTEEV